MRATVCELSDDPAAFEHDWSALVAHVRTERSELVLLPEMPFGRWFAVTPAFDGPTWRASVDAHDRWLPRLRELGPAAVLATRPVDEGGRRFNEAFVWSDGGYRGAHRKAFLPREEGFWEANWYDAGDGTFDLVDAAGARLGFQICTELWSMTHAQRYGQLGAQIIAVPRATSKNSVDKWVAGGRVAGIVAGAFTLSSNRTSPADGPDFGGGGWITAPDGQTLGVTSRDQPFFTAEIDLAAADAAKGTYPRYALPPP